MEHALRFRGPGRRSLGARSQKVSKKSRKKSPGTGSQKSEKKISKKVRKVKGNLKIWVLGDFSDLFRDNFQTFGAPGPGDFFETFLRLFGFGPRDSFSQVRGTSKYAARSLCCVWVRSHDFISKLLP